MERDRESKKRKHMKKQWFGKEGPYYDRTVSAREEGVTDIR